MASGLLQPCQVGLLFVKKALRSSSVRRFHRYTHALWKQEEMFPLRLVLPESHGYVPMLSPSQVTSMLTMNQDSSKSPYGPVRHFDSNQLPSNNPIEDRRAVGQLIQTGGLLFGVFDGHGGSACAQAASERLFEYIAISLLPANILEKYNHMMRTETPLPILKRFKFRNDYASEDLYDHNRASLQKFVIETLSTGMDDEEDKIANSIIGYLKTAFRRLDDDISFEAMPNSGQWNEDLLSIALSGSCCCTVHIKGLDLHAANIGDCRAVVGSLTSNKKWEAKCLTNDHNVENEKEAKRLRESHPKSEYSTLVKNGRLLSQLIPIRAFGDVRFKWSVKELKGLCNLLGNTPYAQSIIPSHYYTPPYLIARPEVKDYKLMPEDRFLLLASDGLWEMMTNEEAVNIVGDHLIGKQTQNLRVDYDSLNLGEINQILQERKRGLAHKTTDPNGATHLLRHALGFEHRKVSEMLTFPPQIARSYRDDITIIIIYFDEKYINAQHAQS